MRNTSKFFAALLTVILMSGCAWDSRTVWKQINFFRKGSRAAKEYRPAGRVIPIFQPEQVPVSCQVFSHLLVWIPVGYSGQDIARAVEKEARSYGADMLLIGRSRRAEDDEGLEFVYYGPDQPYNCRTHWSGWKGLL